MIQPFKSKKVCFSEISIRSFDLCIGDSPAVQSGIPISLDWTFDDLPTVSVDDFESLRPRPRRTKEGMRMSATDRERKLSEDFGIPDSHIQRALRRRIALRGITRTSGRINLKKVLPGGSAMYGLCVHNSCLNGVAPLEISSIARRSSASMAA